MKRFFAHKSREVTLPEMTGFFKSLTEAEKNEFKAAALAWDGQSEFISGKPLVEGAAQQPSQLPISA